MDLLANIGSMDPFLLSYAGLKLLWKLGLGKLVGGVRDDLVNRATENLSDKATEIVTQLAAGNDAALDGLDHTDPALAEVAKATSAVVGEEIAISTSNELVEDTIVDTYHVLLWSLARTAYSVQRPVVAAGAPHGCEWITIVIPNNVLGLATSDELPPLKRIAHRGGRGDANATTIHLNDHHAAKIYVRRTASQESARSEAAALNKKFRTRQLDRLPHDPEAGDATPQWWFRLLGVGPFQAKLDAVSAEAVVWRHKNSDSFDELTRFDPSITSECLADGIGRLLESDEGARGQIEKAMQRSIDRMSGD